MTRDDAPERRRHRRVPFDAPIRLSTIDAEIDPWTGRAFFRACEERCANLSQGGLLVHAREPLAPGRRLLVEVDLPDGHVFEAIARVAWTRAAEPPAAAAGAGAAADDDAHWGLGLAFLAGAPEQRVRLERVLGGARRRAAPIA